MSVSPALLKAWRWLKRRHEESCGGKVIYSFRELMEMPEPPQWHKLEIEEEFRRGYEAGFDRACEEMHKLYRKKGFVRPTEIVNILLNWSTYVLRYWPAATRYDGKNAGIDGHEPKLEHESWADIRARIIRRDRCCTKCGDVVQLEVDHITEVQDGGLPEDENLRVLCKQCHVTKNRPVTRRRRMAVTA